MRVDSIVIFEDLIIRASIQERPINLFIMAILVKPVQRINPLDKEAPKKWYVTQVTTAQADETEVAMELAERLR